MKKLHDCVFGQAIGDALGVPFEFQRRGTFECERMKGFGTHFQPAGTWSDDTSMVLAICDSYKRIGRIDIDDIRSRFIDWFKCGAYTCDGLFDIGTTTAMALNNGHGLADKNNNGNGSLMRTIPLAFTNATDAEIEEVSAITHAHEISKQCCVKMVHIARELICGKSPQQVLNEIDFDYSKPECEIKSGGYVLDTFEASLWCLANTSSYSECVLKAVNLGDDTDTTGAVAGALAGIVYGFDKIPKSWIRTLKGKEIIERCLF
jgi:ADP-ribosylglycohydrolase